MRNHILIGLVSSAAALTVATPASAQYYTGQQPGILTAPIDQSVFDGGVYAPDRTLATQRQRLATMIALRDEMTQLRAADGGTLSDENRAYLTRKANQLLAR